MDCGKLFYFSIRQKLTAITTTTTIVMGSLRYSVIYIYRASHLWHIGKFCINIYSLSCLLYRGRQYSMPLGTWLLFSHGWTTRNYIYASFIFKLGRKMFSSNQLFFLL